MKCEIRCFLSFVVLVFLCGCAPVTMTQLLADGKAPLSGPQLHELLAGHSLHLEAIDFDAKVQYLPNGHFTATSLQGEKDKGKWSISANDELCMKFNLWYFGDLRCYTLFNEKDKYVFFTANGARYYTGMTSPENDDLVANQSRSENSNNTAPEQSVPPATRLSRAEREHTLISLARNCPDCNFAGVDLRGAQLIAANLAGANLSGADLRDANLRRANLAGANLSGAKLARTNLAGADLTDCDLSDADLTGSNLIRANVTGAKFKGAILSGAHLESIQGFKE
jgi:hypothetical protein